MTDPTCMNLKFRDYKHGDFPRVLEYLNLVDWDSETGCSNPGAALDRLYGHINHAIDTYYSRSGLWPVHHFRGGFLPA